MGRVFAISSQTIYGAVGNSAAVPALQADGHEVMALPTVLLSYHPGHRKPVGQVTEAALLAAMWDSLEQVGALQGLQAIYTGYFVSAAQVITIAERLTVLRTSHQPLHLLVDPVIGDHGRLYVDEAVAAAIRDRLLPLATITTPNVFELQWLTGESDIFKAVARLGTRETLVTSVPRDHHLATLLFAAGEVREIAYPLRQRVPHGTGDFLAAAYLSERLSRGPPQAFDAAMARLQRVITQSSGTPVLRPLLS